MRWYFQTLAIVAWFFTLPSLCAAMTGIEHESEDNVDEFASEERLKEGFLTSYLNKAIAKGMSQQDDTDEGNKEEKVKFGRNLSKYISAPKFGGYFVGKFDYTTNPTLTSTNGGFTQRMVRLYIDGTILGDFAYRVQVQTNNNSFHMKDYFIEWRRFKEFKIKIGQFKRAFGMENPMNPWDVGTGDYSMVTKMFTGHTDYNQAEATNNGGRDQGIQIQGDLFPIGEEKYSLIHYQVMLANGQGINTSDANKKKDIMGTIQFQPIKGLFIGAFIWNGSFTDTRDNSVYKGQTLNRKRVMVSGRFERNDWTVRAEYCYSRGNAFNGSDNYKADGWYATIGVPCTSWLKVYGKYDVYRATADFNKAKTILTLAPNFQLHKNLMIQAQYNFVNDRSLSTENKNYSELWAELYVRF